MRAKDARARRVVGRARRTYLPLEGQLHKPTDYEVTTTDLLYYGERGFEVHTPVWQHYVAHQRGAQLRCADWEAFSDPARNTYSSYVAARRDQEAFLDRLFERTPGPLAPELRPLLGLVSAWRFPLHGFQMTAAYVGSLAPSGRVTVVCALQAADELRCIQRLCQWLARSGASLSELDALGRELWQRQAGFQPLRRLVEELLVTYDWGQALVFLNGLLKPVFDRLWFERVAASAARYDDPVLGQTLSSMADDARWHEAWFGHLLRSAVQSDAASASAFTVQVASLRPRVAHALRELLPLFEDVLGGAAARAVLAEQLESALDAQLAAIGAAVREVALGAG